MNYLLNIFFSTYFLLIPMFNITTILEFRENILHKRGKITSNVQFMLEHLGNC